MCSTRDAIKIIPRLADTWSIEQEKFTITRIEVAKVDIEDSCTLSNGDMRHEFMLVILVVLVSPWLWYVFRSTHTQTQTFDTSNSGIRAHTGTSDHLRNLDIVKAYAIMCNLIDHCWNKSDDSFLSSSVHTILFPQWAASDVYIICTAVSMCQVYRPRQDRDFSITVCRFSKALWRKLARQFASLCVFQMFFHWIVASPVFCVFEKRITYQQSRMMMLDFLLSTFTSTRCNHCCAVNWYLAIDIKIYLAISMYFMTIDFFGFGFQSRCSFSLVVFACCIPFVHEWSYTSVMGYRLPCAFLAVFLNSIAVSYSGVLRRFSILVHISTACILFAFCLHYDHAVKYIDTALPHSLGNLRMMLVQLLLQAFLVAFIHSRDAGIDAVLKSFLAKCGFGLSMYNRPMHDLLWKVLGNNAFLGHSETIQGTETLCQNMLRIPFLFCMTSIVSVVIHYFFAHPWEKFATATYEAFSRWTRRTITACMLGLIVANHNGWRIFDQGLLEMPSFNCDNIACRILKSTGGG